MEHSPGQPSGPSQVHPGDNMGNVRLEMLPEPTEKHQPWPGNRDLFRPVAGNRAGLCACPSLPLEKPTFPSRETPNGHTYTAPLCVPSPEPGGPTSRALCSEAPGSPHGPPHPARSTRTPESDPSPGPRARSSKPKRVELPGLQGWLGGNARSGKGPAAKEGSCGDRGQEPPSPGDNPQGCPAAGGTDRHCPAEPVPTKGTAPSPAPGSGQNSFPSKLLPTAEILRSPRLRSSAVSGSLL